MSETPFSPKKVTEDISVPGMIVKNAAAAKEDDSRIRIEKFCIGGDDDDSAAIEALLNRDDIYILDYHKYTFQHAFYVVITYSEPKAKVEKPKET